MTSAGFGSRPRPADRGPCGRARCCSGARIAGDRGAASVLVALWTGVLTALAGAVLVLSSVLAARTSLASATDLAALAGAGATLGEPRAACARARAVARTNGARVLQCRVQGASVWVVTEADAPAAVAWLVPGRDPILRARAHAELTARGV